MQTRLRKLGIGALLIGVTAAGGAAGMTALGGVASAQTSPPSTSNGFDPTQGGHVGANGVKEELLTGDTATKATAAALAAVPGGTVQRVETDAEGATYEAHMLDASGKPVTVKMDAGFKVTGTETGPGGPGGPGGRAGPGGPGQEGDGPPSS